MEWKVDTHIRSATGPTSPPTRSFISAAALLVKVMARISTDLPAMAHEIGNAAGKHGSLARTSAGHDEQRAARVGNGLKLLRVKTLGQGIGRIRLRARCARCAEAAKGAWVRRRWTGKG